MPSELLCLVAKMSWTMSFLLLDLEMFVSDIILWDINNQYHKVIYIYIYII